MAYWSNTASWSFINTGSDGLLLDSTEPLFEPLLTYCQFGHLGTKFSETITKIQNLENIVCNICYFVQSSISYLFGPSKVGWGERPKIRIQNLETCWWLTYWIFLMELPLGSQIQQDPGGAPLQWSWLVGSAVLNPVFQGTGKKYRILTPLFREHRILTKGSTRKK